MADQDTILKNYFSIPEIFADLFNAVLFHGEQTLKPESLHEVDSSIAEVLKLKDDIEIAQRYRDVVRKAALGIEFVLFGIENQSFIHYGMPIRSMTYDALTYTGQMKDLARSHKEKRDLKGDEFLSGISKQDRLTPVITLVIYYGNEPWCGPCDLYDMLALGEHDHILKEYIPNYKINLMWACGVTNLASFQTGLRELFGLLRNHHDSKALEKYVYENRQRLSNLDDDTFDVASVLLNMDKIIEKKEHYRNEKGGHDMCQAILEIEKRGEKRGIDIGQKRGIDIGQKRGIDIGQKRGIDIGQKRGIDIGQKRVNMLNQLLISKNRMDDLARSTTEPDYQQQLFAEFGI